MLDYLREMDGLDYSDIHIREGKRMALRQAGTIVKTDRWVSGQDIVGLKEDLGEVRYWPGIKEDKQPYQVA